MEYCNGRLCISTIELFDAGIVTKSSYSNWIKRNKVEIARRGGGPGKYTLIIVNSLPNKCKDLITLRLGAAELVPICDWLRSSYKRDQAATVWFYRADTCVNIGDTNKNEYIVNASVLNSCIYLLAHTAIMRKLVGNTRQWGKVAEAVEILRPYFGHTLPTSSYRLRKIMERYMHEGYACLLSRRFGNRNAKKI